MRYIRDILREHAEANQPVISCECFHDVERLIPRASARAIGHGKKRGIDRLKPRRNLFKQRRFAHGSFRGKKLT